MSAPDDTSTAVADRAASRASGDATAGGRREAALHLRLTLMISLLLALATLVGAFYLINKAREDVREEVGSTLDLTRHFLETRIGDLMAIWRATGYSPPHFQLQALRNIRHLSIVQYDADGQIVDSNALADREVLAPPWFDSLIRAAGPSAPSQNLPLTFEGRSIGRLAIAPDPTYETAEMWSTCQALLGILVLFLLLINALIWVVVSRLLRPVERIVGGFAELRAGRVGTRLPDFSLPELHRIGLGFNHMATELERSESENLALTQRLIESQETERATIARELHDEIAQCVSGIHAEAAAIRNRGDESIRESAVAIIEAITQLKVLVRSMLQRLRPPSLEGLGLAGSLRQLVETFRQRNPGTLYELHLEGPIDELGTNIGLALYRIVQEGLANIAMHATATQATIELTRSGKEGESDDRVHILIRDNGSGLLPSAREGLGLTGMRERVRVLGGTLSIQGGPGEGSRIQLAVPVHQV